jgi:hypothetical protein
LSHIPGLKSLSGIHRGGMAKTALEDLKVVVIIHRKGKTVVKEKIRRGRYINVLLATMFKRLALTAIPSSRPDR